MPHQFALRHGRGRAVANLVLVLTSLLITAGILEAGSRIYLAYFLTDYPDPRTFLAGRPAPYRNAPYFGPEFLDEMQRAASLNFNGHVVQDLHMRDTSGKFINIVGGFRVTTDMPADPERRLLLFGASVVVSFNVPDGLTIASQLQRLLNERIRTRWEVHNLGVPAIASWNELELLKKTPVKKGDIVIFYDGGMDIDVCVFHGIPPRLPADYIYISPLTWYQRTLLSLHNTIGKVSAAAEIAFNIYANSPPPTVTNPKLLENNLARMTTAYEATLTEAAEFVEARGGSFVHFLNPNLLTIASPDSYERSVLDNPRLGATNGYKLAFVHGQPALQASSERLRERHLRAFSLSDAFDHRPKGDEIFIDASHVNHRGNEIIANRIFDRLLAEELLDGQ